MFNDNRCNQGALNVVLETVSVETLPIPHRTPMTTWQWETAEGVGCSAFHTRQPHTRREKDENVLKGVSGWGPNMIARTCAQGCGRTSREW